jgi:AcrR family transcriptional regulator
VEPARRRILDAAARRFAAAGALATTLDDVRTDAQVSVGAVYHHFADKQGLAEAVWLDALERYQRGFLVALRTQPDPRSGITGAVRHHLAWVARHRDLAQILLGARPAGARALNEPFLGEVRAWWRAHAHYGALADIELDLAHALWLGPSHEYCRQWLAGRARRIPPAVAEALADAAWASVKGPEA